MEKATINQNVLPEIHLFPRLEAVAEGVGHLVKRLVSFCPLEAPDYMSTHYDEHPLDTPLPVAPYQPGLWE